MLKLIIIAAIIAFCAIALAEDTPLSIPGKFLNKGQSIACEAEGGCIIMTPKELAMTANAIQRKVLENHVCGFKSEI